MVHSLEEKVDMIECYFKSNRNSQTASDLYFELYPERAQPHRTIFARIVNNLRTYGSFEKKRDTYQTNNAERRDIVLETVNHNPNISVRRVDEETRIPKSSVHRILKDNNFHPFKPLIVQKLNENDFPRRIEFCRWYVQKCQDDGQFQSKVLWTDETRVTNCGVFNKHNYHYWAAQNPHLIEQRRFQNRFGFNVWCGMIGKIIIVINFRC
jgi:hypothetical protein